MALAACRACRQPPTLHNPEDPAPHYLLGASTWPGEETILLEIFRQLQAEDPSARLILVPRHVERCGAIEAEMRRQGAPSLRWSHLREKGTAPDTPSEILLVDTTGELTSFCAMAEVIFVGKSLCRHGGQNLVEPAAFGKAIVLGPHMENFPGIMDDMHKARALIQVADRTELAAA
ncbi:MAG: hypothetical protein LC725_13080, partial [Lentisphaerae bacterium]|nr:hypothetical protein [Lentisphaerota bacterium]